MPKFRAQSPRGGAPQIDLEAAQTLRRLRAASCVGWGCEALWIAAAVAAWKLVFEPRDHTGYFNANSSISAAAFYAAGAFAILVQQPLVAWLLHDARRHVARVPGGPDASGAAIHALRRRFATANGVSLATGLLGLAAYLATGNAAAFGFLLAAAAIGHARAWPGREWEAALAELERR